MLNFRLINVPINEKNSVNVKKIHYIGLGHLGLFI